MIGSTLREEQVERLERMLGKAVECRQAAIRCNDEQGFMLWNDIAGRLESALILDDRDGESLH